MRSQWSRDSAGWEAKPLAERLEVLRKTYCMGPSGQSSETLALRSASDIAFKEARVAVIERDALRARVAELEKQLAEKDKLLAAYEAVRWPKTGEEF